MKTDSKKMVQGMRAISTTLDLDRQGYLHAAFVVEAEVVDH